MTRKIDGYEVLGTLGSGAFGKTHRVRKNGKLFALKVLKPEAIRDEIDRQRFRRECRALQKIVSPNVIPYYDHGAFDDDGVETFYIVMGFTEGTDLRKHLRGKSFPLPEHEIRSLAKQVLSGLAAIHSKRLVHRDLKPSNIFLAGDGTVQILDFGLVKMLDYTTITHTGGMVGTPLFMSPEEMLGTEIDHRSDLYSFGVLLFYLFTGRYPLTGDNHLQLVRRVTQEPPEQPRTHLPSISNRVENLILRLLEKEPYLRPSDADEVARLIERTAFYSEEGVPPVAAKTDGFERKQCWIRLLTNEKTVMTTALSQVSVDGVVFQANYLPKFSGHLQLLRDKGIPYLFDPSTNRLAYSKFSQTKGLRELPYVYDRFNRMTPESLQSLRSIRRYVKDVLDWQIEHGCSHLVAPFHFASGLASPWMSVNFKLLAEAREYAESKRRKEKLFAGVCINIEEFTDEQSRKTLVNRYSREPADGYLFYVDPIQERNAVPAQLFSFLSVLVDFKELGRPVCGGRIGNMGLGVLALGIDTFEAGIASLAFFNEQDLLADRPTHYTMKVRYYLPDLLTSLQVEAATDILASPGQKHLACPCPFCDGRTDASIGKTAKQHFLWQRAREVEDLNQTPASERLPAFLERAERAHSLTLQIRKKLGIKMPPAQHFKVWAEVFPEVAKRVSLGSTRTR